MQQISFSGVPFLINDSGELFVNNSNPQILIGTYKNQILDLHDGWTSYYGVKDKKSKKSKKADENK